MLFNCYRDKKQLYEMVVLPGKSGYLIFSFAIYLFLDKNNYFILQTEKLVTNRLQKNFTKKCTTNKCIKIDFTLSKVELLQLKMNIFH